MSLDFKNTNLDSQFKTDEQLEENGMWFDTSPTTGFLCRRFGGKNSQKVKAASAKFFKPYAKQLEIGALSDELSRELTLKCFIDACLVDWKGVEVGGASVPFSAENALGLLSALPALADSLIKYATEMDNYKVVLGNS